MNIRHCAGLMVLSLLLILSCNSSDHHPPPLPIPAKTVTEVVSDTANMLRVTVLPCTDGIMSDSEVSAFKYPSFVPFDGGDSMLQWKDSIVAFGTAFQMWVGPKGWTGRGASAVDGGVVVYLFPVGADSLTGSYISYYEEPACVGCILSEAAPYFPVAMKQYNESYNEEGTNPIELPKGLKLKRISPALVSYTLPVKNGKLVYGIAYFTPGGDKQDLYFTEARFIMTDSQASLRKFLMKAFIDRVKQNQ